MIIRTLIINPIKVMVRNQLSRPLFIIMAYNITMGLKLYCNYLHLIPTTGLAFSVRKGVQIPPSLRNIYKELNQDPNINTFNRIPTHGYLEKWSKQGVLMLNTVLTVRRNEPNSHSKKGWESFTDEIIKILMMRCYESNVEEQDNRGIVFLLWGKPASLKAEAIIKKYDNCFMQHGAKKKNVSRHTTICTSHPSPLGATKTDSPFLGSRCFSRANAALVNMNMNEIDWYVDD